MYRYKIMKANLEIGLKVCSKCRRELLLDSFTKNKRMPDGLWIYCIECSKERAKMQWSKNKDSLGRSIRQSRLRNLEKSKNRDKQYYEKNKEKILAYRKEYGSRNKNILLEKAKFYLKRRRLEGDVDFIVKCSLRARIISALKSNSKSANTLDLLGCSMKDFRNYIESQFEPGMTWENHGYRGWHIDHIIPISYFDLSDPEQQKLCFNYRNLQPLWWKDNRKKSDKVPGNVEELVEFLKQEITIS